MPSIELTDPVFRVYAIAAAVMILKVMSMSWLTVVRMLRANGAYRSPEDTKQTLLNPKASATQTDPIEGVERVRRIHMNDLENVPFFLAAGFLYVLTGPSLLVAQVLFYGYVVTRLLHFVAYLTAQTHDVRATLWTPGSLVVLYMAGQVLWSAFVA